ncbi:MAG: MFS transporter [Clostridia bacterium]|nr:MFS transporter [Clostridia bacterium]
MSITEKKRSFLLIAALILWFTFISMTKNAFSAAMVYIVNEGILTKTQTGSIVATFYLIYAALQFSSGVLADRWKPDVLITVGYLGAGIANLVIYLNHNYTVMLITWSLCAVIQAPVWPSVFKLATTRTHKDHQSRGIYLISFANSGGAMLIYFISALLPKWEYNFLMSACGLLLLGTFWECVRRTLCYSEELPRKRQHPTSSPSPIKRLPKGALFGVLSVLLLLGLLRGIFDTGVKGLIPTMISDTYPQLDPSFANALNVLVILAGLAGITLSHYIYPHFFKMQSTALLSLMVAAIIPTAVLLGIGRFHYGVIVAMLALISLLMCGASLLISYISAFFNWWNLGGTVAGLCNCVSALGIVVSNYVFPKTSEVLGWIGTIRIWVVLIVMAALFALLLIPIWKRFLKKYPPHHYH